MISELLSLYDNLPDVWGEGAIFAFSGIDGETCSNTGFVASFAARPYGLLIHTPQRRVFDLLLQDNAEVKLAVGDVLAVDSPSGGVVVAYSAWHTLVGTAPESADLDLRLEDGTPAVRSDGWWLSANSIHGDVIALLRGAGRFALAYGSTEAEARERAEQGVAADVIRVAKERLAFYWRLTALPDPGRDRLLKKCASVMKVNTLAPEGVIEQSWSTPDRIPHQHMWLWDSVFHSLAMNYMDPRLSWSYLKSVLAYQRPDGMIPHMMTVVGLTSEITQPPILAWGVWENYLILQDRSCLEYAFPRLEKYLEWDLANRDQNHNHLLEWFIEGDVNCRSGESGLDNSPRFDKALVLDAVDFSTFAALDMQYLSQIADELGLTDRADVWSARAAELTSQIHTLLWDETASFYFDRNMDGTLSDVRAATGFLPLLLDDLPVGRAARLVAALNDPAQFNTAFPVPSLSVSHPDWSTDMWRGATWINLNYLIIRGLAEQGYVEESQALTEKTIATVDRYYRRYGVMFEFFDAKDERPPLACDRKGARAEPYDIRRKYDSIRDYHWTAALTACLLEEPL